MKTIDFRYRSHALLVAAALAGAACGDDGEDGAIGPRGPQGPAGDEGPPGEAGMDGEDGMDGSNSLVIQTQVGPGDECPNGGIRIDSGIDLNDDGMLGTTEIDATNYVCSGGEPFTLQLLHFADIDSNEATALGAVDEFSGLVDGFRNDPVYGPYTIVVSSGDNVIPGPRWFAAENGAVRAITGSNEPGHVDHYWMNQFGVVASALGNHDLDQGPGEFADMISSESRNGITFPGSQFPYLAANVDFSAESDITVGTDGEDYRLLGRQVAGSAIVRIGREVIGLVGCSTPELPSITTTGNLSIAGDVNNIADLAAEIQPEIDALVGRGVNKIIVLAHLQQIQYEKALAEVLQDVDIIVAGGSNTRMGDMTDALFPGDTQFAENYPYSAVNADGDPILVVNTDADYKYLGRLVVSFDESGVIIPGSLDEDLNGAWASTPENVLLAGGMPIPEVIAIRDAVQGVISSQYENVIGHTDVFLEGRRNLVRTEETNLGNLTSDSMKWYTERCTELSTTSVLALKNGGGIRAEIGDLVVMGTTTTLNPPSNVGLDVNDGDVSEGHLRGTLRFDNGLAVLDVSGSELKGLLEHGVRRVGPGVVPGEFPQVAGIWFSYDPSQTAQVSDDTGITTPGSRIRDLWVDTNRDGTPDTALYSGGVVQTAASATYTLVTLNFLAGGGDGYPFAALSAPNRRNAYSGLGFGESVDYPDLTNCDPGNQSGFSYTGGEQDALAEYMLQFHPNPANAFNTAETSATQDRRIQDLRVISSFVTP